MIVSLIVYQNDNVAIVYRKWTLNWLKDVGKVVKK